MAQLVLELGRVSTKVCMRAKEHWQLAFMIRTVPVLGADVGEVAGIEPTMGRAVVGKAFPVMCEQADFEQLNSDQY